MRSSAPAPQNPRESTRDRFERTIVPLLDDAYTLAHYLLRDEHDAQDAVQEAFLRAWRHYAGFRGSNERAWLLTIVRNCCYTWRHRHRTASTTVQFDDDMHGDVAGDDADARAMEDATRTELRVALDQLTPEFREAIVLREIEGMTYDEIARVIGAPVGTVMSRLSRARRRLQNILQIGRTGDRA